jgi:HTH-type transcriptional regulator / antitoxin HigA
LLTLLIEKYDEEHNIFEPNNLITILRFLMKDQKMKSKILANFLNVSEGLVSVTINYIKGLSKEVIRKLADKFKELQDAFNRPYKLDLAQNNILTKLNTVKSTMELSMA